MTSAAGLALPSNDAMTNELPSLFTAVTSSTSPRHCKPNVAVFRLVSLPAFTEMAGAMSCCSGPGALYK